MEHNEHWAIKAIDLFFTVVVGRALVVSTFFVVGCLMLNVPTSKALALFAITYVDQVVHLGRRSIERLSMVFLAAATLYWIDILPLRELASASSKTVLSIVRDAGHHVD